jgi:hypothetical protein
MSILLACCGEWMANDFPFISLVRDAVPDLELHGEDAGCRMTGPARTVSQTGA